MRSSELLSRASSAAAESRPLLRSCCCRGLLAVRACGACQRGARDRRAARAAPQMDVRPAAPSPHHHHPAPLFRTSAAQLSCCQASFSQNPLPLPPSNEHTSETRRRLGLRSDTRRAPAAAQRPTRDGRSRTRQASTHPRGLDVNRHLGLHAAATTVCASLFDLQASSFRFPHLPLEAAASARAAARQPHSARTRAGAGIAASWR
jgi:hypothetical protein